MIGKFPLVLVLTLLSFINSFSQKTALKTIESNTKSIEISTVGLDDLVIENSKLENIEITLYSDDETKHHIVVEEEYEILKIAFEVKEFEEPTEPVMKPITERLKRANAVIRIPENKDVSIYGINNNISALNFKGDLSISIENGIVKLATVQQKVVVKLYAGNVFSSVKKANVIISSNLGKINVDEKLYAKTYQSKQKDSSKELKITTIKANVFVDIL